MDTLSKQVCAQKFAGTEDDMVNSAQNEGVSEI